MAAETTQKRDLPSVTIGALFEVRSGDFHAVSELDPGTTPLISCGTTNNGLVGYFDIPAERIYRRAVTVAYNGLPLTAKYHPYAFGAKDDVAVLVPRTPMSDVTLLYVAAVLNCMRWRYSYGRKCFREKLQRVPITIPLAEGDDQPVVDEAAIARLFSREYQTFLPDKSHAGVKTVPALTWKQLSVLDVFSLARGDFHSITDLAPGPYRTVSRVTTDNGTVGYYERPEGAAVYSRGHITVSTVGGDSFVQLDDFIATDNVIICTPKQPLRITSLFFLAFMLNHQKWRYGYGRQCYLAKFARIRLYLPVTSKDDLDEDAIEQTVVQTGYWREVEKKFPDKVWTPPARQSVESDEPPAEQLQLPLVS